MRLLILYTGEYGRRHLHHIEQRAPATWTIESWQTPAVLPPILDYPEDYLPEALPAADLILSLAEVRAAAEMIPEIARMTGARAAIAPIDNQAWLPFGLARQLRQWCAAVGVTCVTPMPFCSLTEGEYNTLRQKESYDDPLIQAFARHFGRPRFEVVLDEAGKRVEAVRVTRDAGCGCAVFAAAELAGTLVEASEEAIGLHHHHYPCQASMGIDPLYHDTLMHVSGNIMKAAWKEALGDRYRPPTFRPAGYVEP